jgi:Ca2+-binding EF-hand superfamily protein
MKIAEEDFWRPEEVFALIDRDHKGWVGAYDIERMLCGDSRAGKSLPKDVELVIGLFDKSGRKKITLENFNHELTPIE